MDQISFRKSEILARQMLFMFVDLARIAAFPFFDSSRMYKIPMEKYDEFRMKDKEKFRKELYRLSNEGYINKLDRDGNRFFLLTRKGKNLVKKYLTEQLDVPTYNKWDKKWRLVVFDIPIRENKSRDIVRHKLENIGFVKLQASVYVYPFECIAEINYLKNTYKLSPYIQYVVAERIETEVNLIKKFLALKILNEKML